MLQLAHKILEKKGSSPEERFDEAVVWLERAANLGNAEAQCEMASTLRAWDDFSGAFDWDQKAAKQGWANSQYNLGVCCRDGIGTSKNPEMQFYWYGQAANNGVTEAKLSYAICFLLGVGTAQDFPQAVYWLRQAADEGNAEAKMRLGTAYIQGIGCPVDTKGGISLLREAASLGNEKANELLNSEEVKNITSHLKPQPPTPVPSTRTSSVTAPVATPHYIRRNRQVAHGGMGCYDHPSQLAVANCRKCGKGLCKDCFDVYGVSSGEYAGQALCYHCTTQLVAENVVGIDAFRKQVKWERSLVIFSGSWSLGKFIYNFPIPPLLKWMFLLSPPGMAFLLIVGPLVTIFRYKKQSGLIKQFEEIIASDSHALEQMRDYFAFTQALEENEEVDVATLAADNTYANAVLSRGEQAAQTELRQGVAQIAANGEIIKRYNVA